MPVDRVIRDGSVAVLYSPGYGLGWSSESPESDVTALIYDPVIVGLVENARRTSTGRKLPDDVVCEIKARARELHPDAAGYGVETLKIEWIPLGCYFRIEQDDGYERIDVLGPDPTLHKA